MLRRVMFSIFALAVLAVLVGLGIWQVQRLGEKEAFLGRIAERIGAEPVALPAEPDSARDEYLSVRVRGDLGEPYIRVLVSRKRIGAGYRIISPMQIAGRRILIDRGFVPVARQEAPVAHRDVTIIGNLHWPDETDSFTPENELDNNIWYARDVDRMAAHLDTEPLLVVARETSFEDAAIMPFPVNTAGIPNDHLQYAFTWFSLAAVWVVMAGTFLWRNRTYT